VQEHPLNWLALRNWKEAERVALAALATNPVDERAAADLVEAYCWQDRFDEALAVCATVDGRQASPALLLSRAVVLILTKQPEGVVSALTLALELIETRPEDAWSMFIASRAFALVGRQDLAVAAAHRTVVLNPTEPRFMSHLGELLIDVDVSLAEGRLRQSLRLDPLQADALNALGVAFMRQTRLDEAAAALTAALKLAPGFTLAKTNLWLVTVQKRRLGGAWVVYTALDPSGEMVWSRFGVGCALGGSGIGLSVVSNWLFARRLARRDPELAALTGTLEADMNSGRIGYKRTTPGLRFFGRVLLGLGAVMLFASLIGEVLVIRHFMQTEATDDLLGMGLMAFLAIMGGVLLYEGRRLLADAARVLADRG
jgi:Flp pilus assembly protein TadD